MLIEQFRKEKPLFEFWHFPLKNWFLTSFNKTNRSQV